MFARILKWRSSPKETVIDLNYSREHMLANEENSNQRHLVTTACEALLMTMVLSALCKHIWTYTHTHTHMHTHKNKQTQTHAHTGTHMHTNTHTQRHKHIYTIIFIYRMKCLTFYSLNIWKRILIVFVNLKNQSILKNYHSKCDFSNSKFKFLNILII